MNGNIRLPEIGELIDDGKYRIDTKIGEGAMGAVYAATHMVLQNRVAMKWLLPKLAKDETSVQRFLSEAKIAARIEHPNVVRVIDVSTKTGLPYFVTELLEGDSLDNFLKDKRLALEKAGRIFAPVLRGVAAAHEKGIIHRDLKPANIFLARSVEGRTPKILDFGIAKLVETGETQAALTQTGNTFGTILYMSPEQLTDSKNVNVQTDVYALGVILYRMLTGKLPYEGNILDLVLRIHTGDAIPMTKWVNDLSADLNSVVMRAMARKLDERYRDVASFARDLAPFFPGEQLDRFQQYRISDPESQIGEKGQKDEKTPDRTEENRIYQQPSIQYADEHPREHTTKPINGDEEQSLRSDRDGLSTFAPIDFQRQRSILKYRLPLAGFAIAILITTIVIATIGIIGPSKRTVPGVSTTGTSPSSTIVTKTETKARGAVFKGKDKSKIDAQVVGSRQKQDPDDGWGSVREGIGAATIPSDARDKELGQHIPAQTETPTLPHDGAQNVRGEIPSTSLRSSRKDSQNIVPMQTHPPRQPSSNPSNKNLTKNKSRRIGEYSIDDDQIIDPFSK